MKRRLALSPTRIVLRSSTLSAIISPPSASTISEKWGNYTMIYDFITSRLIE